MFEVTAEKVFWMVAGVMIAAILAFGTICPWVVRMSACVEFSATAFVSYNTGYFEFMLKNLGNVAIVRLTIKVEDALGNVYIANSWFVGGASMTAAHGDTGDLNILDLKGAPIPSGEAVQVYTDFGPGVLRGGMRLTVTIKAEGASGKSVTHQYMRAYVRCV